MEGRVGLEGDDLYPRVVLLEPRRRSDEGPARTESGDEMRDLAGGLLPDLRRRGFVVRARVGRVAVLVGLPGAFENAPPPPAATKANGIVGIVTIVCPPLVALRFAARGAAPPVPIAIFTKVPAITGTLIART